MVESIKIPNEFDFTMLDCYQVCQKRYYYRHVLHLVGKRRQTPLEFGSAVHGALDVWYKEGDGQKAVEAFRTMWSELGGDCQDDAKRTEAKGIKILRGYFRKYAQEPFEVVDIEIPFEVQIGDLTFIGRIDKVIKWDGIIGPMDHKTSSQLAYTTFNQYNPNMQLDGYMYACRKLYDKKCYWAVPDVLLVAKTREDYARKKEARSDEQIEAFPGLFKGWADAVQSSCKSGRFLPRYSACTYYGQCPYRQICMETANIQERVINTFYEESAWDPRNDIDESKIKKVIVGG